MGWYLEALKQQIYELPLILFWFFCGYVTSYFINKKRKSAGVEG